MDRNVVIVGAGPGGLASAMLAARMGCKVTVLERAGQVGGRTSTLETDGFRFDRGPTFFLYPDILRSIFEACGRSLDDEVELTRLDPNYRLVFEGGGQVDSTCHVERLKEQIATISPEDAAHVDAYMADNKVKLDRFRPILETPFLRHRDFFKLPLLELLPLMRPWATVDRDLKRFFNDERIRLAFSFQSKYLGMSPFRCPSLFTILAYMEYEFGVFHPTGGCGAVSEAMARVAREMGVEIALEEPVEEILLDGRRASGVRTNRRQLDCDALIVNADFAQAMHTLVPDGARTRWTDRKLARKKYSCSTFMLYLGLEGECPGLAHHTIFLADGYAEHLKDIDTRFELTQNPSFYVQNPCVTDSTMAPPGCTALYVLVPVPHMHDSIDWSVEQPGFRRQTLHQLEEHLGIENIESRIRVEHVCTPADWAADLNIYRGATFSMAHSLDQMLSLRPRNRFEDLDGVYLTGGGTHPGSGLPTIFQSAKIATDLLAEDLGIADSESYPAAVMPEALQKTG
ncbi:MAG: phytoene desaturase family protein [Xanthomonadales bacterium]|nr:phytoene desaturase family protein [Xanthomonadales bacterium]